MLALFTLLSASASSLADTYSPEPCLDNPELFACDADSDCIVVDGIGPCCCQNGGQQYAVNAEALARFPTCGYCGYGGCIALYNCGDFGAACYGGTCELTYCGNNRLEEDEQCDDGNWIPGDGCLPGCLDAFCGHPMRARATSTVADALFILRSATEAADCEGCVCDTDGDGTTTVSDALMVLGESIGLLRTYACPACD